MWSCFRTKNYENYSAKVKARYLKADVAHEKFKASNMNRMRQLVDLMKKDCACRKWHLTRIPFSHVIARMLSMNVGVLDYVDSCCQKAAYLRSYSPLIHPISKPKLGQDLGKNPLNLLGKKKQARRLKNWEKDYTIRHLLEWRWQNLTWIWHVKDVGGHVIIRGLPKLTYLEINKHNRKSQRARERHLLQLRSLHRRKNPRKIVHGLKWCN